MNVVFLSPHFPPQFHLFCKALRAEGATVLGIGDCPPDHVAHETRSALTEYVGIPATTYDELFRAVAYLSWRHGKIDRIESLNEFWLGWEAQLRDDFNVEGPGADEMSRARSKTGMREIFQRAGVPCTEGEPVRDPAQLRAFVEAQGLPVVLKPDLGVGAHGTFKVSTPEQLDAVLSAPLPQEYVVERFVTGRLTSFDGLADRAGRILFCTSHVYSAGVMEMVTERLDVSYYNRRVLPEGLEALGRKVIDAFGMRERFFHLELFEEEGTGALRALELNLRPPGGFTTDMFNYSADIDIYALWAKVLTGRAPAEFPYERTYHCAHVSRRFGPQYRVPHEELVERLGPALVSFRVIPEVLSGAMGNLLYLVRFPELEALQEAIALITARG